MSPAATTLRVDHESGDRFSISVREHELLVDQPVTDGGEDLAATPTEMFVASLAACVAFYARRYLARHGLRAEGLSVTAEYEMAARPSRVGGIRLRLEVPAGVPEERRAALLATASHCTVHNSLRDPPQVAIELQA
jgi:uncharacterized OsmC-like protein